MLLNLVWHLRLSSGKWANHYAIFCGYFYFNVLLFMCFYKNKPVSILENIIDNRLD